MIGSCRSPANGGKRPSESTLFLPTSPSKMRRGAEPMERGTSSGPSEMVTEPMERRTNSGPPEMGSDRRMARPHVTPTFVLRLQISESPGLPFTECSDIIKKTEDNKTGVDSCDGKEESKDLLQNGQGAPQSAPNMQPPFVNPKFALQPVTDESAKPTDKDCSKPNMTQQTDHPATKDVLQPVSVRRKKQPALVDAYEVQPPFVTSQPSSHRRQQRKHKGASDGYNDKDNGADDIGPGNGRNVAGAASSRPSHSGSRSRILYMDGYDGSRQRPQAGKDESAIDFGNLLPRSTNRHHQLKSRNNNVHGEDLDEEERTMDKLLMHYSKKGLHMDETETTTVTSRTDNCDGAQTQCQQNGSLHPPVRAVSIQLQSSSPENWLQLPPLAVWQIWRSLCTDSDRTKMRLVSSEWFSELPKLMAPRPWLMGTKMVEGTFHSVDGNRLKELKFTSEVPAGCFCGSCQDYIISESNIGCSLWNPSDGMVLPLPLKSYNKIVMLATTVELAFAYAPGKVELSYGRPGVRASWKPVVCADRSIQDIGQCGKEFYAVNAMFRLYRLDQETGKMVMLGPQQRSQEIKELLPDQRNPDHILLADLNEELLVIALGRNLQSVQIFKVSWLDEKTTSFVLIADLGVYSIFLGKNQSIALNSMEFPGIQGNSLYIALEPVLDDVPQSVQIYSLQAKTVIHADYPSYKLGIPFFFQPGCVSTCE